MSENFRWILVSGAKAHETLEYLVVCCTHYCLGSFRSFLQHLNVQLSSEAKLGPAAPDRAAAAQQERGKRPPVDSAD